MKLFVAGLSYKTAPVAVREKLALGAARAGGQGCLLKLAANLDEVVLISTCNRVEVYGVTPEVNGNVHDVFRHLGGGETDFAPYLYVKQGAAAVEHLFAVAGGLDSMVLGETEITGQVKQAYQAAQTARLTGRVTNRLFQTALQTAKEIRTQTSIGRGATSVGSVAVELAERIFDQDLSARTVMILGAGKMGQACVKHLAKKGARSVMVTNRSYERAQELALEFGGRAVPFDQCLQSMAQADIVVSSTSAPQTVLHREDIARVMAARQNRPLFLIDIAVPRDIDAEVDQLQNVYLYNVDHLQALVRENVRVRERELAKCRSIITERTAALMAKLALNGEPARGRAIEPRDSWALAGAAMCHG